MNFAKLRRQPFFIPVVWSILLHILFIGIAMLIVMESGMENPREKTLNFKVKSVDTNSPVRTYKRGVPGPISVSSTRTPGVNTSVSSLMKPGPETAGTVSETPQKGDTLNETLMNTERNLDTIVTRVEENEIKDKIEPAQKTFSETGLAARMAKNFEAASARLAQSLPKSAQGLFSGTSQNVNIDPEEGMPGFTPMQGSMGNSDFDQGPEESNGDLLKYEVVDQFLDIQVLTYEDPSDKQSYYMIKIMAKKDAHGFKVMPKEILFAVDCSLSIQPGRLDEFKKGITYCLSNFNEGDVFNIISFKDRVEFFSPQSAPATPENIEKAAKFVSSLTASEQTDVYLAFNKIVEAPPGRNPSSVILLSDGQPTHGVVDSRELINLITRVNGGVRPVFAFSGGGKVNRYLLDFIAYQNRAWSQFMKKTWDIRKGLADFYDKIRNPIFLNLRYRLNGLEEKEVFPKSLPDFYTGAEFTLYGKYSKEDDFSMQLLGDVDGKTKELIFSRSLQKAPRGDAGIMKGYAFNKIYYLISQVTLQGKRPELLKEIEDLSKRYGITTPYSPDLAAPAG